MMESQTPGIPIPTEKQSEAQKTAQASPVPQTNKPLIIGLVVIILLLLGSTGYLIYQNNLLRQQIAPSPTPTSPSPSPTADPTANWKTYTNDKYKVSFKYPENWEFFSESKENYINRNKDTGFKDECLINYYQVFIIQDEVSTPWGLLSSFFDLGISVTNPEGWALEKWVDECRPLYEVEMGYVRKEITVNDKEVILFYKEEEPGPAGSATHYIYMIKNGHKFYSFMFQNHKYLTEGEDIIETLLRTINFL